MDISTYSISHIDNSRDIGQRVIVDINMLKWRVFDSLPYLCLRMNIFF